MGTDFPAGRYALSAEAAGEVVLLNAAGAELARLDPAEEGARLSAQDGDTVRVVAAAARFVPDAAGITFDAPPETAADNGEYDELVLPAVELILDAWREIYRDPERAEVYAGHSGYLEIKNTRVIRIQDEPRSARNETGEPDRATDFFGDIAYIVEFIIYSDYYSSEPYYIYTETCSCILVHRDGQYELFKWRTPLELYSSRVFEYNYSRIIEEIVDLNGAYNAVYHLLEE